jgi:hypothetical protein
VIGLHVELRHQAQHLDTVSRRKDIHSIGDAHGPQDVFVSDFSAKEIGDDKHSATITVKFGDGRRGVVVADAHVDDAIISEIVKVGRQQARRGRRPKSDG